MLDNDALRGPMTAYAAVQIHGWRHVDSSRCSEHVPACDHPDEGIGRAAMLSDSYTPTVDWYLALDWKRHMRPKARDWIRELLRTDILLSAMFKASHDMAVTAGLLI